MNETVSLKDIARMANTSVATVSRVINQNGRFSRATEKKILKLIEEYDYKPNALARGLRARNSRTVGILVPDITNVFFSSIIKEVQYVLNERDYTVIICNTDENDDRGQSQAEVLKAQKAAGLIYIGNSVIPGDTDLPRVYVDRVPENVETSGDEIPSTVQSDNAAGGYMAGSELLKKGVKNPAFISYEDSLDTTKKRRAGFLKALSEGGIPRDRVSLKKTAAASYDEGYTATKSLLKECPQTDGIFYYNDALALGGLSWLMKNGFNIPRDIKIIGFDDVEYVKMIYPGLTTIRQDTAVMGRLAAERILDLIEGNMNVETIEPVPVRLIVRDTT